MAVVLSIFLGVVPAFFYALFVYWLDRYEKEPLLLLGATFIWGAVVAAGGAFILNTIFGLGVYFFTASDTATEISTASISAPLVEESLKGLAVLIVFLLFRREFDNLLDGVVYAGIAALGFAATENSLYIYRGYAEGGAGGLIALAFIRNVLVGWQHPFYTAFIGIGFAVSRLNRSWLVKLIAPLTGWVVAVIAHAFHNGMASTLTGLGGLALGTLVDWTGWLFMLGVIIWAIFRERKFLVRYLKEEVDLGLITAEQYKTACSAIYTSLARTNALIGRGSYPKTNRFYEVCSRLAHKKRQLEMVGDEGRNRRIIAELRAELAVLARDAVA